MTYISHFKSVRWQMEGITDSPIIAISGLSGSGKDTYSELLQKELKDKYGLELEVHQTGHWFRKIAESYGYEQKDLHKFSEARQKDPALAREVDIKIDTEMFNIAMTKGGILVGRLTYALVGDSGFKAWINCDARVAAERIAGDKNRKEYGKPVSEIEAGLLKRDMADIRTYEQLYGLSYFGLIDKCDFFLDGNMDGKDKKARMLADAVVPWLKKKGYIK